MNKEQFELIELLGLSNKGEIEFCLLVSFKEKRKSFIISYPVQTKILRKFKYNGRINFN